MAMSDGSETPIESEREREIMIQNVKLAQKNNEANENRVNRNSYEGAKQNNNQDNNMRQTNKQESDKATPNYKKNASKQENNNNEYSKNPQINTGSKNLSNSPNRKIEPPSPYSKLETPQYREVHSTKDSPSESLLTTIKSPNNNEQISIANNSTSDRDYETRTYSPKKNIEVTSNTGRSQEKKKIIEQGKMHIMEENLDKSPVRSRLDNMKKTPSIEFDRIDNKNSKASLDDIYTYNNKNLHHHTSNLTNQSDLEAGMESGIEWEEDQLNSHSCLHSEVKLTTNEDRLERDKRNSNLAHTPKSSFKDSEAGRRGSDLEIKTILVKDDSADDIYNDNEFDYDVGEIGKKDEDYGDIDFEDNLGTDNSKSEIIQDKFDRSRNNRDNSEGNGDKVKLNIQSDVVINENFEDISKINSARKSDSSFEGRADIFKSPSKSDSESRRPNLPIKEVLKNLQQDDNRSPLLNFSLRPEGSNQNNTSNERYKDDSPKESTNISKTNKDLKPQHDQNKDNEVPITANIKHKSISYTRNEDTKVNPNISPSTKQGNKVKTTNITQVALVQAPISEETNILADAVTEAILQILLKREIKECDRLVPKKCVFSQPMNSNHNDSMSKLIHSLYITYF